MKTVGIREARETDCDFVENLIPQALEPFYGGDHRAHARRIFEAHIAGGVDTIGHFSTSQKMFLAEVDGKSAGIIHVVGKKQRTYKISPLIVHTDFQGDGVGATLLRHAEEYAQSQGAKQMYCTVAKQNLAALQFFLRHGYVICGKSSDHYKMGITEMMLYKTFMSEATIASLDKLNISVVPFDEQRHTQEVRELILAKLPEYFEGVDDRWVDALIAGWRRRDSRDVNQKYKLIYVAVENSHVVGVAGATPKKGEPIKIMPLVARYPAAFMALLSDLPFHLMEYGRKIYVHIVPNVEEVMVFQRLGWSLDCMMPGAYRDQFTTQQWSLSYGENFMKTLRIKERFLRLINSGAKTLEVRVGYTNIQNIKVNETILLSTQRINAPVRIKAVRKYTTFADMLEHENPSLIVPGMNKAEVQALLVSIYPPEKEKLGVYVLEVSPERSAQSM